MKKTILVLIILGLGALLPQFVQAKSWQFDNWDVYITVNEDSTFDVTESHIYNFQGEFSWVQRDIPINRFREIKNIVVTDGGGNVLTEPDVEITESPLNVAIKINFSAKDEVRIFNISYKIIGGLGFFADHDELYWNAVSSDREVPIKDVYVEVKIPPGAASDQLTSTLYVEDGEGEYWVVDDQTFAYQGQNVDPYYNFTIVAGWPKGIVEDPGTLTIRSEPAGAEILIDNTESGQTTPGVFQAGLEITAGEHIIGVKKFGYQTYGETVDVKKGETRELNINLVKTVWYRILTTIGWVLLGIFIGSPVVVFFLLLRRWYKYGKDPIGRKTIVPQYEPPDDLSPLLVGTIIDEKVDPRDFTAAIIDFAVKGYLTIIEKKKSSWQAQDYRLVRKKDFEADEKLFEYEKDLLRAIFKNKDEVDLSVLSGKLHTEFKNISFEVYQTLTERGYFNQRPDKVRGRYSTWGAILTIVGLCGSPFYGLGLPLAINGVLLLCFSRTMPRRTKQGVLANEWAKGFKMYLHTAERYRVQKLTPELFSMFLPYAMVFGVEKEWADKFVDIIKEPPDWYQGYHGTFSAVAFSSQIGSSFGRSASAATHLPSSASSSSGFGGGGGAGGGGGGGGSSAG